MSIRHREVAVAVIFDLPSESFLLCHNKAWGGYAFPMKHFESGHGCQPAEVSLQALDDWYVPLKFPDAAALPLDYHLETLRSDSARDVTVYEYHVFAVRPAGALPDPLPLDLRLFTYDQLQDAGNVTSSTKVIARSIVEDRKVAVAVITRSGNVGREFLLVNNPSHGYFFPATRIKTDVLPAEAAMQAARSDLGYNGPWEVIDQALEVPALKQSARFGSGDRRFHYHICLLKAPEIDLQIDDNALEIQIKQTSAKTDRPEPYWRWATENQLRTDAAMSRSMPTILLTALQLVSKAYK